jgi:hypothetical protein
MKRRRSSFVLAVLLAAPLAAGAQDLVIYPAKGQSKEQQQKDRGECYAWAMDETGFDPANTPAPAATMTTAPRVEHGDRPADGEAVRLDRRGSRSLRRLRQLHAPLDEGPGYFSRAQRRRNEWSNT